MEKLAPARQHWVKVNLYATLDHAIFPLQVWYGRGPVRHNAHRDQEGGRACHTAGPVRGQDRLLRGHPGEARQVEK